MRIKGFSAAAAALALITVAFTPSAAVAESCPRGFICFYLDYNQKGEMSFKIDRDWDGRVYARSYFNNAYQQTGFDHVDLTVQTYEDKICAHYGDPEGKGNIAAPPVSILAVTKVKWRGEC
ncbi:peptidase inhibitor family I36 protein [Nonomuraea purpurea]|uniref:Peptidase inhibitor family I36 protein n=1 Tax=Nonomuraea purpurea TaxID=1849276 RepID=A0ABV8GTE0_9ACTN